jgi:hypothetical protein
MSDKRHMERAREALHGLQITVGGTIYETAVASVAKALAEAEHAVMLALKPGEITDADIEAAMAEAQRILPLIEAEERERAEAKEKERAAIVAEAEAGLLARMLVASASSQFNHNLRKFARENNIPLEEKAG